VTNAQLLLAILIPTITVLVGILLNHTGNNRVETNLNARISAVESNLGGRLTLIEGDLRRFYQILGEHGARLDNLEKQ